LFYSLPLARGMIVDSNLDVPGVLDPS
jgi:hypothetical protein